MADQDRVTITPSDNGPNIVKGPITLVDADGKEFEAKGSTIALCRCGASGNKPFCDGTHSEIGFSSEPRA